MNTPQAGILLPLPPRARYLSFVPDAGEGAADCLQALAKVADGERTVVGRCSAAGLPGVRLRAVTRVHE